VIRGNAAIRKERSMDLDHLIYILSIVFGVLILVSPKMATYLIGAYLIAFGVIKLIMVLG
jgi:uncharacterized membrane protein HdeD (DUF308 family)